MSRHKSGRKKTRYYCNEKIDNQNVYLHELCLTDPQYPDQESSLIFKVFKSIVPDPAGEVLIVNCARLGRLNSFLK